MAEDRLHLVLSTVEDNIDDRQVEFVAEADGDEFQFAIRYSALEALSGEDPAEGAVALFDAHVDEVLEAAAGPLNRDKGAEIIVISENDLN